METQFLDIHNHGQLKKNTVVSQTVQEYLSAPETWQEPNENKFLTIGIHPWQKISKNIEKNFSIIEQALTEKKIIAVGECGIDRVQGGLNINEQMEIFERQIFLAEKYNVPLVIHSVRAHSDVFSLRKRYKKTPWLIHGFIGNEQEIQNCLRHNIRISPGLALLLHNNNNIWEHKLYHLLQKIPVSSLYLETDGVNIDIKEIYRLVAEKKNIPIEQLANQIEKNFLRDFQIESTNKN